MVQTAQAEALGELNMEQKQDTNSKWHILAD